MVRATRFAAALGATLVLIASACDTTENPLAPEARPMRDGGGVIVGGNATGGNPGGGVITTQTSAPRVAESDSTSRGGGTIVGGN